MLLNLERPKSFYQGQGAFFMVKAGIFEPVNSLTSRLLQCHDFTVPILC